MKVFWYDYLHICINSLFITGFILEKIHHQKNHVYVARDEDSSFMGLDLEEEHDGLCIECCIYFLEQDDLQLLKIKVIAKLIEVSIQNMNSNYTFDIDNHQKVFENPHYSFLYCDDTIGMVSRCIIRGNRITN